MGGSYGRKVPGTGDQGPGIRVEPGARMGIGYQVSGIGRTWDTSFIGCGAPRRRAWAARLFVVVAVLVGCGGQVAAPIASPAPERLLNSERIERRFGSYGVEVLEADEHVRVSNLYSVTDGRKVCRTLAVVVFPATIDPRVATEHQRIVAGGSIGAVLKAAGWTVRRRHQLIGSTPVPAPPNRLSELMGELDVGELAFEVYTLVASRPAEPPIDYAVIAEIHHPEHLDQTALAEVLRGVDPQPGPGLDAILARVDEILAD